MHFCALNHNVDVELIVPKRPPNAAWCSAVKPALSAKLMSLSDSTSRFTIARCDSYSKTDTSKGDNVHMQCVCRTLVTGKLTRWRRTLQTFHQPINVS